MCATDSVNASFDSASLEFEAGADGSIDMTLFRRADALELTPGADLLLNGHPLSQLLLALLQENRALKARVDRLEAVHDLAE